MKYPCVIEKSGDSYGVIFPDLEGCYPAGDTIEEAFRDAREAAEAWMENMLDEGFEIPPPSSADDILKNPDYKGRIFGYVDIDVSKLSGKTERINISLPSRILRRLDEQAKAAGDSRSGYIASLVLQNA